MYEAIEMHRTEILICFSCTNELLVWSISFQFILLSCEVVKSTLAKFHYADLCLRQSRRHKSWKSATQITSDFHDLCPRLCRRLYPCIVMD